MKIIVTGSEGNVGRKLVPYLRECGHEVLRVDIEQNYADDYIKSDVMFPVELFSEALKFKPEAVFHMAAMVSRITCEKAPALTVNTNIAGTMNVIELCRMTDAKLINFSTSEVYGNIEGPLEEDRIDLMPNNLYGLTKLITEDLVEYQTRNGLDAVTVRPFMIYDEDESMGEHRSAMIRFAEKLLKKEKITVHANSFRSWLHISDFVTALERCLYVKKYTVINIGHPKTYSAERLADLLCMHMGRNYKDLVEIIEQPEKMTLNKKPDLKRQESILKFVPKISLIDGCLKVAEKVKRRCIK